MSNWKRKQQRRKDRPSRKALDKVTVMVPVFGPIWEMVQLAAKEMGIDPVQLVHNTLGHGISDWLRKKERESSRIEIPGMTLEDRLKEELRRGQNKQSPADHDRREGVVRES